MTHKNEFRRLLRESFTVEPRWVDWFMDEVYTDDELLALESDGKLTSAMLLSPYPMNYRGQLLPAGYMSCVATARSERGKGNMHRLMIRALVAAAERGDALVCLIPASRRLYFFYDRFGFSTVFYIDEHRYTSVHRFPFGEQFHAVEPDYDMFRRLESIRPCGIRHDEMRYHQIVKDIELDGGFVVAASDDVGGEAMAFVELGREAKVLDILYSSDEAADAVMALMREKAGERPVIVRAWPSEAKNGPALRARGMARIVNVEMMLSALAASDAKIDQVVRVYDPIIPSNNGIYILHKGECEKVQTTLRRVTLDVTVDVLTRLLFSSPSIGQVFDLPTERPLISLMLD